MTLIRFSIWNSGDLIDMDQLEDSCRVLVLMENDFQNRQIIFDSKTSASESMEFIKELAFGSVPFTKLNECLKFHQMDDKTIWTSVFKPQNYSKTQQKPSISFWSSSASFLSSRSSFGSSLTSNLSFKSSNVAPTPLMSSKTSSGVFSGSSGSCLNVPKMKRRKRRLTLAISFILKKSTDKNLSNLILNCKFMEDVLSQLKTSCLLGFFDQQKFITAMRSSVNQSLSDFAAFCMAERLGGSSFSIWQVPEAKSRGFVQDLLSLHRQFDQKESKFFLSTLMSNILIHNPELALGKRAKRATTVLSGSDPDLVKRVVALVATFYTVDSDTGASHSSPHKPSLDSISSTENYIPTDLPGKVTFTLGPENEPAFCPPKVLNVPLGQAEEEDHFETESESMDILLSESLLPGCILQGLTNHGIDERQALHFNAA